MGGVESRIRIISAETEAEALLGLAELGKNMFYNQPWIRHIRYKNQLCSFKIVDLMAC